MLAYSAKSSSLARIRCAERSLLIRPRHYFWISNIARPCREQKSSFRVVKELSAFSCCNPHDRRPLCREMSSSTSSNSAEDSRNIREISANKQSEGLEQGSRNSNGETSFDRKDDRRRRKPPRGRESSTVEDRVALAEYAQMMQLSHSPLNVNSAWENSAWEKLPMSQKRHVLAYWLSKPVQQISQRNGQANIPWERAQAIVDWVFQRFNAGDDNKDPDNNQRWVLYLLGDSRQGGSPNAILTRMIALALQPFKGSVASLNSRDNKGDSFTNQSVLLQALVRATSLAGMMQSLHTSNSLIQPDGESCESLLNLWYKRARFLSIQSRREKVTAGHHSIDTGLHLQQRWNGNQDITTALGGATSVRDCITKMRDLIDEMKDESSSLPRPDTTTYTLLLSAFALCHEPTAACEAEEILNQAKEAGVTSSLPMLGSVLSAYAHQAIVGDHEHRIQSKQNALEFFNKIQQLDDPGISDDPVMLGMVLNMLGRVASPEETQAFLDDLEVQADRLGGRLLTNQVHYNIVMSAWGRSSSPHASDRAAALFDRMTAPNRPDLTPDRITYNCFMQATSSMGSVPDWLKRIDRLLGQMEESASRSADTSGRGGKSSHLDSGVYLSAVHGILRRLTQQAEKPMREEMASKAEGIVERLRQQSSKSALVEPPDIMTYNTVLKCWALSHSPRAFARASDLLDKLNGLCQSGHKDVCPNVETYEWVMKCLATKAIDGPVELAQTVLDRMSSAGIPECLPVVNQFLRVLAKSGSLQEAESLLNKMEADHLSGKSHLQPDEASYRAIMEGYARQGHAVQAHEILDGLKQREIIPSQAAYTIVLEAWSRSQDLHAGERAKVLFEELRQHHEPIRYTYAAYQSVWSRSRRPEAPIEVESILRSMQQDSRRGLKCGPDAHNFAVAIHCWASSRQEGSAERAEFILMHMLDLCKTEEYHHLKPTANCFSGVLLAWARSAGGTRAVAVLERMEGELDLTLSNPAVSVCYVHTIWALRQSDEPNRAERAFAIWERMLRHAAETNIISDAYMELLKVCGRSSGSATQDELTHTLVTRALEDYLRRSQSSKDGDMQVRVFKRYLEVTLRLLHGRDARTYVVERAMSCWPKPVLSSHMVSRLLDHLSSDTMGGSNLSEQPSRALL